MKCLKFLFLYNVYFSFTGILSLFNHRQLPGRAGSKASPALRRRLHRSGSRQEAQRARKSCRQEGYAHSCSPRGSLQTLRREHGIPRHHHSLRRHGQCHSDRGLRRMARRLLGYQLSGFRRRYQVLYSLQLPFRPDRLHDEQKTLGVPLRRRSGCPHGSHQSGSG